MKVSHKAFLDLERALSRSAQTGWRETWRGVAGGLKHAILTKNWHHADKLIDTLKTDHLVLAHAPMAQTVGMASLLLGASRLGRIRDSQIARHPPVRQLKNAVTQWGFTIHRNLPVMVKRRGHLLLARLEHEHVQSAHVIRKEAEEEDVQSLMDDLEAQGDAMSEVAASLMVSRLSSFGFLQQAQAQGVEKYQISEVLDDDTCDVCQAMDGQVFSVDDGISLASSLMDAEDPDSLASIAPWPDSADGLEDADAQDLVDSGLALPPYHPGCRGIADVVDASESNPTADQAEAVAEDVMPDLDLGDLLAGLGITAALAHRHPGVEVAVGDDTQDEEAQLDQEEEDAEDQATDNQGKKKKKKQVVE